MAVTMMRFQHRLEIERLAAFFCPYAGGDDDVAGRCVTEFPIPLGRIAIEIEQQRRNFLAEAVQIERLAACHHLRDLVRRGTE